MAGKRQLAASSHLVEAVHAGGGLLGDALDPLRDGVEYQPGRVASLALIAAKRMTFLLVREPGLASTERSFSARAPRCSSSVASPPSSRIMLR
jgi:hypothetical protein